MNRARRLRDPQVLGERRKRIWEPHVAPLNMLVEQIRAERSDGSVPWFDPAGGGVNARALLLLEAPGPGATAEAGRRQGSGFVSLENDDQTAQNMWELREQAGLSPGDVVHWNIVPWYVGNRGGIRAAKRDDIAEAEPYLRRLLGLLPKLKVVVLMGKKAQIGWKCARVEADEFIVLSCPHPSPQAVNRYPGVRDRIHDTLREARQMIETE